jgi:hypothetical protein
MIPIAFAATLTHGLWSGQARPLPRISRQAAFGVLNMALLLVWRLGHAAYLATYVQAARQPLRMALGAEP